MKVIIAEKPSVAREIAGVVGASEKKDGYLEGKGYCVTWAIGHLVTLAMPKEYGINGFDASNLPIIPDPYLLVPRQVKKGKDYIADPVALKQLKIIKDLFQQCKSIIVATDAGREGELIFRYIYEYLQCRKPFERLWISSLTERAIKQGLESIKPGNSFEGIYHAALGRSRADWMVGINATQALSIQAGDGIYSLGRVQTPTLALICKRFLENKDFSVQSYYQIELFHQKEGKGFTSVSQTRWDEQKQADDVKRSIERNGMANIVSIDTKTIHEQPPLLFDLTGLQKEANNKLNFTAEKTLDIAQGLYEKKFITYPRTGSKYIPEDLWTEIPNLARALKDRETCAHAVDLLKWGRLNRRIVNDLRVTDHHGLLVTGRIPSALAVDENAIYDMIAFRLLEALSWDCVREITHVNVQVLHHDFLAKGVNVIEGGWRMIRGNFGNEEGEEFIADALPTLQSGEQLKITASNVLQKKTKAPALYTEATLLHAMEHAGNIIPDPESKQVLKSIGIGTPATRANIIETLFDREYVSRIKKWIQPAEKGLQVYQFVKDMKIADVSMTAEWEMSMQQIEQGEADLDSFLKETKNYTSAITAELLKIDIPRAEAPKLRCPKCKRSDLLIRDKLVKCKDEHCGWLQFRNVCGQQLSIEDIRQLVEQGRTPLITGMKSKAGKAFNACIVLNEEGKTTFEFDDVGKLKT